MQPLVRTKTTMPRRRSDLVSRGRILNELYNALDKKLVIVSAPAGYGKTSLLVDMAYQIEMPACWFAIHSLDNEASHFLAYFLAAIAEQFPEFGQKTSTLLQSIKLDETGLNTVITLVVNEIYETIQEHFVLVLDDFHLITDKDILYFINQFIQLVDETCHLVIASRHLVVFQDMVLLVGRSQVAGLGMTDLAFQADEIQELLLQNFHQSIDKKQAEELAQETEGWITGLLLSAQTMWRGMVDQLRVARVSGVGLYDYLVQQVFEQQPTSIQEFLLHTSLFEEFDAGLCLEVLGPPQSEDWQVFIDKVLQSNLFVLPVDNKGTWLRYHHLFQEFLQHKMEMEYPDETLDILRRLAAIYLEHGSWEKAHDLYQRIGDKNEVVNLIKKAGISLIDSGRFTILGKWIDDLPGNLLNSHPLLLSLRGYAAAILGETNRSLKLLDQAVTHLQSSHAVSDLVRTLVWRAGVNRLLGHYNASLNDANQALSLTKDEVLRAEALKPKGQSLVRLGRLDEAISCLKESLTIFNDVKDVENVARLSMELGVAYFAASRYEDTEANYLRALEHWRKTKNIRQGDLLNNLGVLYHLKGNYQEALNMFEEALGYAQQGGHSRQSALILCSIGDVYVELEALEAAHTAYIQARKIVQPLDDRFILLYSSLAEANLARLSSDFIKAQSLLDSTDQLIGTKSNYERGLYNLEAGRLSLTVKQPMEAVRYLEDATMYFNGQRVESIRSYLYLAMAYYQADNEQAALAQLETVFQLVLGLESQHPVVVASRDVLELLNSVDNDSTFYRQVKQLTAQVDRFEMEIPILRSQIRHQNLTVSFVSPHLKIKALGKFKIELNGNLLTTKNWRDYKKGSELLLFILAHPEGVTREEIGLVFWPDRAYNKVKTGFKNLIYRLRRATYRDVIILAEDTELYYFNRAADYEYDVEMFQQEIEHAQATKSYKQRMVAYEKAVELYTGSFLENLDGVWVLPERERLSRLYLKMNLELVDFYQKNGHNELAIQYCRNALAEDPCLEEAHRQAMKIYAAMGNRAAIARQYKRCQQALKDELDVPVSAETSILYEKLIN